MLVYSLHIRVSSNGGLVISDAVADTISQWLQHFNDRLLTTSSCDMIENTQLVLVNETGVDAS